MGPQIVEASGGGRQDEADAPDPGGVGTESGPVPESPQARSPSAASFLPCVRRPASPGRRPREKQASCLASPLKLEAGGV